MGNGGDVRADKRIWLACFVAGACDLVANRVMNEDVIAVLSVSCAPARDAVFALGGIVPYFLLAFLVRRRRVSLDESKLFVIALLCMIVGAVLTALAPQDATAVRAVAFFACLVGGCWSSVLFLLSLCELGDARKVALCVCAFYAVGSLGQWCVSQIPSSARLVFFGLASCATLVIVKPVALVNLRRLSGAGAVDDLEISNPRSFVSPSNPVFWCVFVFQTVFGLVLALNCVSGVPVDTSPAGLIALAVGFLIWVLRPNRRRADQLAIIAGLLVVSGLLLAMVSLFAPMGFASNYVLKAGDICLGIICYLVIASMGARNKVGAIVFVAYGAAFRSLGTLTGTLSGHAVNSVVASNDVLALACLALILFVFIVLAFVWLSSFDFEKIVFGIQPLVPIIVSEPNGEEFAGLEDRCAKLADRTGLTKREREILVMLAKGRNGKFIGEHFTLSYNTVKTHVKHIYMKLDVHSQQELIDLVDSVVDPAVDSAGTWREK